MAAPPPPAAAPMAAPFPPPAIPPTIAPTPAPPAVVNLSRCLDQKLRPCLCPSPTQAEWVCVVLLCRCLNLPQVLADAGTAISANIVNTNKRPSAFFIVSSSLSSKFLWEILDISGGQASYSILKPATCRATWSQGGAIF